MAESRTSKSLKNARTALIFYFLQMLLGFWSRKVFYDYLGSEVLGLDTTAATILGFLNLAELGIGSAVGYFLYQPFYANDYESINKIVSVQGWIYRRIAAVIILGSVVLMFFFPRIFSDITIPLWYAYATFGVLLFGALLGYYVNYKICVLYADQREYKVTMATLTANMSLKVILIVLLPVVSHPFLFYLGTSLVGTIFGTVWINRILKKNYPWLKTTIEEGRRYLKEYPDIIKKTKQLFVGRIATVIIFEIQPLIMYAFSSLSVIAYYGNYIATIGKAKDIIKTAFNSTQAGVGNLVASRDSQRMLSVFWELYDSRMCISTAALIVLGFVTPPFISVWLSPDYLLGNTVLFLVILQYWIAINRTTIDHFIVGHGLFHDIWAPITEMVIYLGGSFVLGYFWGIAGVLMGGLMSNLVIICAWKPYFLFSSGFNLNPFGGYFVPYIKRLSLIAANCAGFIFINNWLLEFIEINNYLDIAFYGLILSAIVFPVLWGEFTLFSSGMRCFNSRIKQLISNKICCR